MEKPLDAFNWNAARTFLAVCEQGNLSAAARVLRETQPTLGRQLAKLEEDLGTVLFERLGRTLRLTPAGEKLRTHFLAMAEAAQDISLLATQQAEAVEGTVTVTAINSLAVKIMPRVLKDLSQIAPKLQVHIHASETLQDVKQREADIAIRHLRPTQGDVIGKLVYETHACVYTSEAYMQRSGPFKTLKDFANARIIAPLDFEDFLGRLQAMGMPLKARNFHYTSNSSEVIAELVSQGFGITFLLPEMAERYPSLIRVMPEQTAIPVPVWLICHRELKTAKKIRLVFDAIERALVQTKTY